MKRNSQTFTAFLGPVLPSTLDVVIEVASGGSDGCGREIDTRRSPEKTAQF